MRRAASQPPDLPGYEFARVLGTGGFSDVFCYNQKLPKRPVAVKVLLTEQLNSASRAQFVSEANVMAQLSAHPYIVTIYHADVAGDGRPYLVMEYCSGPSLSERYKRERFGVEDTLRIGVRLSSAIATAHAAGILHRDIKPGNVLTNAFGWPALTDFGISSTLEDEFSVHTITGAELREAGATGTSEGASVGLSVPWSPPEMFEDEPALDIRSDVFSLVATVHTLLAGRTPFEVPGRSNGTLDLIGRIERGVITPIDRDDIPRSFTAALNKGMSASPADRFPTAVDFARALQRVELELGYTPTSIEVPNLDVDPIQRDETESPEDATRARSVSTIAVQDPSRSTADAPAAGTTPDAAPEGAPASQERGEASTRMRGPVPVEHVSVEHVPVEQTVVRPKATPPESEKARHSDTGTAHTGTAEPGTAESGTGSGRSGRRTGIIVGSAIVAVLVAAAIVVVIVVSSLPAGQNPEPGDPGGGTIDVSTVPKPVLVSKRASESGTAVTFVWKNPKPQKGDAFLWARANAPGKKTHVTNPEAVVTGVVPGQKVCITVSVLRDGKTSPNPLDACYP